MYFTNDPFRRFSVCCPTTYRVGLREGYDMISNLWVNGWRLSDNVPLRVRQTCPLTVHLSNQESLVVAAAIVQWAQSQEYGLGTLVVDSQTQSQMEKLVQHLEQVALESIE